MGVPSNSPSAKARAAALPRAADLLPCPFCGEAGEWREDVQTYWTGMRSQPVSYTLRHWCGKVEGILASHFEVRGKTREATVEQWNQRVAPPSKLEQAWAAGAPERAARHAAAVAALGRGQ